MVERRSAQQSIKRSHQTDLYKTLGVSRGATVSEIRRAFRRRAKSLHPDTSGRADEKNLAAFHALVAAYNTLMDAHSRNLFASMRDTAGDETKPFDYHEWLSERNDDESQAKLVFWDLMHGREEDAIREYCTLIRERAAFSMRHWFPREDFMDLGYILAEELDKAKKYRNAFDLLSEIIAMEGERSYFRLFFPEVLEFARRLSSRLQGGQM